MTTVVAGTPVNADAIDGGMVAAVSAAAVCDGGGSRRRVGFNDDPCCHLPASSSARLVNGSARRPVVGMHDVDFRLGEGRSGIACGGRNRRRRRDAGRRGDVDDAGQKL